MTQNTVFQCVKNNFLWSNSKLIFFTKFNLSITHNIKIYRSASQTNTVLYFLPYSVTSCQVWYLHFFNMNLLQNSVDHILTSPSFSFVLYSYGSPCFPQPAMVAFQFLKGFEAQLGMQIGFIVLLKSNLLANSKIAIKKNYKESLIDLRLRYTDNFTSSCLKNDIEILTYSFLQITNLQQPSTLYYKPFP